MIRLGLRLAGRGGRGAFARLGLMAVAIGLGIALILVLLGGIVGSVRRSERIDDRQFPNLSSGEAGVLWARQELRIPGSPLFTNFAVAAQGVDPPVPPGTDGVPAPGTVLVSPELRHRIDDGSFTQPIGRVVGTLGRDILARPDDLVAMTGWEADALRAADPDVLSATYFPERTDVIDGTIGKITSWQNILIGLPFVLLGVSVLLLPVLVLVGAGARIGARRRDRRLAALRLAGATPREMRVLTAVEGAVAGIAGSVLGLLVALGVRQVAIGRDWYFAADLMLPILWIGLVVVLGPVLAAGSAAVAMGRVAAKPLAPAREVPGRVSGHRWWVLAVAWVVFIAGIVGSRQDSRLDDAIAGWTIAIGFVGIVLGLVACGPELVQRLARELARRARRPAVLLAGRRLQAQPRLGFRAVLAVLLSLFVATLLLVFLPSVDAERPARDDRYVGPSELRPDLQATSDSAYSFVDLGPGTVPGPVGPTVALARAAAALRGVQQVLPIIVGHAAVPVPDGDPIGSLDPYPVSVRVIASRCRDFAAVTRTSSVGCRPGVLISSGYADAASAVSSVVFPVADALPVDVPVPELSPLATLDGASFAPAALVPPEYLPPEVLRAGRLGGMYIDTDGRPETARRVAALLLAEAPGMQLVSGAEDSLSVNATDTGRWLLPLLAYVFVLAATALAVVTVDGIFERRRGLAVLRAAGAGPGVLRRATLLEIAGPLLAVAVLGALNGVATGIAFVFSQHAPLRPAWIGLALTGTLLVGLWLAVSAIALPAVTRASSLRELRTT